LHRLNFNSAGVRVKTDIRWQSVYVTWPQSVQRIFYAFRMNTRSRYLYLHQRGKWLGGGARSWIQQSRLGPYINHYTFANFWNSQQTMDVGVTDGRNGVTVTSLYDWPSGHEVHCPLFVYDLFVRTVIYFKSIYFIASIVHLSNIVAVHTFAAFKDPYRWWLNAPNLITLLCVYVNNALS